MSVVTCKAPVNMAVIKYWGKRDENLILPINDSISATLDTDQLSAKTTVMASPDFKTDRIWLNGIEESISNKRLQNCLQQMKQRAQLSNEISKWKLHICSENNFPTAAGLASSAAGYACLVAALAKLYKVEGDISTVARIGSGSACRSTMGGFVRWYMGTDPTGYDSVAKQIVPASHWPEMRILILVVNDSRKKVSSAVGMRRTLETSEFLKYRASHIVPKRVNEMERAIHEKEFRTFAKLTMQDSNQFHAACHDAYPPVHYINDTSHSIIEFIHSYNTALGTVKVAYTFDAGANATLFLLEEDVSPFIAVLDYFFPFSKNISIEYKRGIPIQSILPSKELLDKIDFEKQPPGKLKYIIHTKIGNGPRQFCDPEDHLLNDRGFPLRVTDSGSR
ncbi:diphosphomevalonate decarboxylase [Orussus abietinus]|uniref:diphosphomevalonate decarboxylase n=1 Tax=Orussus abietinus TaxID=222816 RepID=UPI0006251DBE|nr:diphosphomevalonate decarboxylase [Orussus abietinus]